MNDERKQTVRQLIECLHELDIDPNIFQLFLQRNTEMEKEVLRVLGYGPDDLPTLIEQGRQERNFDKLDTADAVSRMGIALCVIARLGLQIEEQLIAQ